MEVNCKEFSGSMLHEITFKIDKDSFRDSLNIWNTRCMKVDRGF